MKAGTNKYVFCRLVGMKQLAHVSFERFVRPVLTECVDADYLTRINKSLIMVLQPERTVLTVMYCDVEYRVDTKPVKYRRTCHRYSCLFFGYKLTVKINEWV